jgi:hypothetical protein
VTFAGFPAIRDQNRVSGSLRQRQIAPGTRQEAIKIDVLSPWRYVAFQMAQVPVSRQMFQEIVGWRVFPGRFPAYTSKINPDPGGNSLLNDHSDERLRAGLREVHNGRSAATDCRRRLFSPLTPRGWLSGNGRNGAIPLKKSGLK